MKRGVPVPERTAVRLLVANQRACCICHERKHLHIHHIDGDTSNNADGNLAPLCLDCHSHVTGDEGLGRSYTEAEVSAHKRAWEQTCAAGPPEDDDEGHPDEPVPVLYETVLLRREDEIRYDFELDAGDELDTSVSATGYVGIMICDPEEHARWCKGKDIDVYMDADDVMEKNFTFEAPQTGTYLLVISNVSHNDIDVTVEVAVLGAEEGD